MQESNYCIHCSSILYKGECYKCLKERKDEMIIFYDMVDSKLFPMTEERKSLILRIIDFELQEISEKIKFIQNDKKGI